MSFIDVVDTLKYNFDTNRESIWEGTRYEWIADKSTCKKGSIGEEIIVHYNMYIGNYIFNRSSHENDLIVNDKKVEVKLSCLNVSTNKFKWLQVRMDDDYDHLYLVGIYPNKLKIWFLKKEDVIYYFQQGIIKPQHGGKRNQDYKIGYIGVNSYKIPEWLNKHEIDLKDIEF